MVYLRSDFFTYKSFGTIIIITAVVITLISSFVDPNSAFEKLSLKIYSVVQILFLSGLFISYQVYIDNSRNEALLRQSNLSQQTWIKIYGLIESEAHKCPRFAASLTLPWQRPTEFQNKIRHRSLDVADDSYESIQNISFNIFQSIESVINYFLATDTGDNMSLWISSFVIWCNSPILFQIWENNKMMYDNATQTFGDIIFSEVQKNTPKNTEDIQDISKRICSNRQISKLFIERNIKLPCY